MTVADVQELTRLAKEAPPSPYIHKIDGKDFYMAGAYVDDNGDIQLCRDKKGMPVWISKH